MWDVGLSSTPLKLLVDFSTGGRTNGIVWTRRVASTSALNHGIFLKKLV